MKDQIEVQAILWTGHLLRGMPLSDPTTALLQAINRHRLTRNGLESNSKTSLVSTACEINRWCPGRPVPNGRKDMASTSTPNENPIKTGACRNVKPTLVHHQYAEGRRPLGRTMYCTIRQTVNIANAPSSLSCKQSFQT
jgi:hypothetical protein